MKSSRSKGITLSYLYFVINTIIGIFMSALIIRTVGKTDYGVYQSMTAFISYLVLLEFGTGTIMARNISLCKKDGTEDEELRKSTSTIWSLTIVLATIILAVSSIFWFLIDSVYSKSLSAEQLVLGKKLFLFATGNLLCGFLTQTLNGFLIGYEKYTFEKTLALIRVLVRAALLVILLSVSPTVFIVVFVDFSLSLICLLITLLFCLLKLRAKLVFKYFDKSVFRQITPLAFAMLLQTIVNTANGSVDKFLISIMMTPEDVSVYSVSMSMFSMFSSVATLPVTMFMPTVAKSIKSGLSGKALTETLVQPCRLNVLITGAVAFGFFSVGKVFIKIVYGESYVDSWLYAVVVIFPMFVNMSNAVVINVIDVLRKRHIRSLILLITTSMNIVMTVFAIKYIGMLGAAAATGFSLLVQTVLLNVYYSKKIGLKIGYLFSISYKGILLPYIIATVGSSIVVYFLNNAYLQLFVGGMVFVTLFVVQFVLFGAEPNEKNIIRKFIFYR